MRTHTHWGLVPEPQRERLLNKTTTHRHIIQHYMVYLISLKRTFFSYCRLSTCTLEQALLHISSFDHEWIKIKVFKGAGQLVLALEPSQESTVSSKALIIWKLCSVWQWNKSAQYGRPAWTINKEQPSTSGSGLAYRHLNRKQTRTTLLVVTNSSHSLHAMPHFVVAWFLPAAEQEADSEFQPVSSFAWLLSFILCARKSNKQNELL